MSLHRAATCTFPRRDLAAHRTIGMPGQTNSLLCEPTGHCSSDPIIYLLSAQMCGSDDCVAAVESGHERKSVSPRKYHGITGPRSNHAASAVGHGNHFRLRQPADLPKWPIRTGRESSGGSTTGSEGTAVELGTFSRRPVRHNGRASQNERSKQRTGRNQHCTSPHDAPLVRRMRPSPRLGSKARRWKSPCAASTNCGSADLLPLPYSVVIEFDCEARVESSGSRGCCPR